jgi:hypothetical protein
MSVFITTNSDVQPACISPWLTYAETLSGRAEIFVIVRSLSRNK